MCVCVCLAAFVVIPARVRGNILLFSFYLNWKFIPICVLAHRHCDGDRRRVNTHTEADTLQLLFSFLPPEFFDYFCQFLCLPLLNIPLVNIARVYVTLTCANKPRIDLMEFFNFFYFTKLIYFN